MITEILNKSDVEKLFEKEAVFVENNNVIPVFTAERLFGKKAVEFAQKQGSFGKDYNIYSIGCGKKQMRYLHYSGFKMAVTYCNIMNVLEIYEPAADAGAAEREKR